MHHLIQKTLPDGSQAFLPFTWRGFHAIPVEYMDVFRKISGDPSVHHYLRKFIKTMLVIFDQEWNPEGSEDTFDQERLTKMLAWDYRPYEQNIPGRVMATIQGLTRAHARVV